MRATAANWTVITGSTGGIGREIAKKLAARGDAMILVNRSAAKANAQRSDILDTHPELAIELVTADLLDTLQIAAATDHINQLPGRIDALYNNAGLLTAEYTLSAQGFESQFAVNTLAPYQLIQNLHAKMARPLSEAPGMIVNFSSSAITSLQTLELDNLTNPEKVGGLMSTYAQTKLAVTALVPALADDLKPSNILIRAIDPGATKSAMTTGGNAGMPRLLGWVAPLLFSPADKQATKLVDSAAPSAFDGNSGIYVANLREKKMPAAAADLKTQQDLVTLLNRLLATS